MSLIDLSWLGFLLFAFFFFFNNFYSDNDFEISLE